MGKKFSCLLLAAALLAGCAGVPAEHTGQPPPASEPDGPILVDDPDSPYPMAVERWQVDMDGDGADELVELRAEKGYSGNETEPDKWFEGKGMHPYTLVITQGETVWELPLGREDNAVPPLNPVYWDEERTGQGWTQDRDGRPVLVLWFDGLSRVLDVYTVAFQDGEPVCLPVPSESAGPILVDDPHSPYPMAVERWQVDMDGDGADEVVELRAEKLYNPIEPEFDLWTEDAQCPLRFCTLVATKGEKVWERPISREGNEQPITQGIGFLPLDQHRSGAAWTQDVTGAPVLALWTDTMGSGGMGGIYVYAYAFQDGIIPLPVPDYGLEAALDQGTMTAQVTVPETGYTKTLDLNQWLADFQRDSEEQGSGFTLAPRFEDGALTWPTEPKSIDGVYYVEPAEQGLVLRQFISGASHADGMGDLVTTITWKDGRAVVLDQYFDWNPNFWELF